MKIQLKELAKKTVIPLISAVVGGLIASACFIGYAKQSSQSYHENGFASLGIAQMMKEQEDLAKALDQSFAERTTNPVVLGERISKREDDSFLYYDVRVNDPKSASVKTKVADGLLTVTGSEEIKHQSGNEITKSTFQEIFPLPQSVAVGSLQTVTEGNKIVLKFKKESSKS